MVNKKYLDPRMLSSFYNPQCVDCFLKYKEDTKCFGCLALYEVPIEHPCSFHKTREEQDRSLIAATERQRKLMYQ